MRKIIRVNVAGQVFTYKGTIKEMTDWSMIFIDDKEGEIELSKNNVISVMNERTERGEIKNGKHQNRSA